MADKIAAAERLAEESRKRAEQEQQTLGEEKQTETQGNGSLSTQSPRGSIEANSAGARDKSPPPPILQAGGNNQDVAASRGNSTQQSSTQSASTNNDDVIKLLISQTALMQQAFLQQRPPAQVDVAAQIPQRSQVNPEITALTEMVKNLTEKMVVLNDAVNNLERERTTPTAEQQEELRVAKEVEELQAKMDDILSGTRDKSPSISLVSNDDKEQAKGKKIKSGRDLRAESENVIEVPWPHQRVFRIPNNKSVEYHQLSFPEFMHGYSLQMNDSKNADIREHMQRHLNKIMEDMAHMPKAWERIRTYHNFVLTYIERGMLKWSDKEELAAMRNKYVFANLELAHNTEDTKACPEYNSGTCGKKRDHDNVKHVCSHCLDSFSRLHYHPRAECYKLNGPPPARTYGTRKVDNKAP